MMQCKATLSVPVTTKAKEKTSERCIIFQAYYLTIIALTMSLLLFFSALTACNKVMNSFRFMF